MALTKFTKDMNIISALDDEPNDIGGLTAAELKAKFDEGPLALKTYINGTLLEQVAEKATSPVEGNFAALSANGNPIDSGKKSSDFRPSTWVPSATDTKAIPETEKGVANGVATLDANGKLPSIQMPDGSGAVRKSGTATVQSAGWAGDVAPFTYAVTAAGVLTTDMPHISCVLGFINRDNDKAIQEAWAKATSAGAKVTASSTITLYADEKPTIDIPMQWEVFQ